MHAPARRPPARPCTASPACPTPPPPPPRALPHCCRAAPAATAGRSHRQPRGTSGPRRPPARPRHPRPRRGGPGAWPWGRGGCAAGHARRPRRQRRATARRRRRPRGGASRRRQRGQSTETIGTARTQTTRPARQPAVSASHRVQARWPASAEEAAAGATEALRRSKGRRRRGRTCTSAIPTFPSLPVGAPRPVQRVSFLRLQLQQRLRPRRGWEPARGWQHQYHRPPPSAASGASESRHKAPMRSRGLSMMHPTAEPAQAAAMGPAWPLWPPRGRGEPPSRTEL